jgi:para-nitrobenzyl esterase
MGKAVCMGLLLAAALCCQIPVYGQATASQPSIVVEGGKIVVPPARPGGIIRLAGIPYAAPPIGPLRWRAPLPVKPWSGVRDTGDFAADCLQPVSAASPAGRPKSEDCLYLNIWTQGLAGGRRPVFVWIHGGGSQFGSGAQPQFDGSSLAKRGIVVVTINYRLGALGFLSSTALSAESGYHTSGNYGFMDDIAALQWVKRNIAKFGGDPAQVTIGGESSGSVSTGTLMSSPHAAGLFQRVIGESGSVFRLAGNGSMGATSLGGEEAKGDRLFATVLGRKQGPSTARDLVRLRDMPGQAILAVTARMSQADFFNLPVVDGYILPDAPWQLFAHHRHNDVPLLVGWNSGEGSMEMMFTGTLPPRDVLLHKDYGAAASVVAPYYPATNADQTRQLLKIAGDYAFGYPNWKWAAAQSQFGKAPVYVYEFDHAPPVPAGYFGAGFDVKWAGAFHGSEITYVFDNLDSERGWLVTPQDRAIAAKMSAYWAAFIKSGSPNATGLSPWPRYQLGSQAFRMQIGEVTAAGPDPDLERFEGIKAAHDAVDGPEPAPPRRP